MGYQKMYLDSKIWNFGSTVQAQFIYNGQLKSVYVK